MGAGGMVLGGMPEVPQGDEILEVEALGVGLRGISMGMEITVLMGISPTSMILDEMVRRGTAAAALVAAAPIRAVFVPWGLDAIVDAGKIMMFRQD